MAAFPVAVFALLSAFPGGCFAANILYVEPVPSPSHHIWNKRLSTALADGGHNVTVITPDMDKPPLPKNYHPIVFEGVYEPLHTDIDLLDLANEESQVNMLQIFMDWINLGCELILKSKGLQRLLDYPEDYKFDLIIYDVTCGQCLYPLVERFGYPPSIAVTPFMLPPYLSIDFGNRLYTSYIPFYGVSYTDEMSFAERLRNLFYVYYNVYLWKRQLYPEQNAMARKTFGGGARAIEEIQRHFGLLLANIDSVMDYPVPLPPNIIPVGGLHARPSEKLPRDFEAEIARAERGFVVFSLGTNFRSDQAGEKRIQAILKTFGELGLLTFWKYESDNLKDVPKNVIIRKWLPINDLLGHPKARLFVTHGGALSTQETMFHGVPVVGIPLFADQHVNLKKMMSKKLGLIVDFKTLDFESLHSAVKEVLGNPMYDNNIKALSRRYRDKLQTPLQTAVFYVEYTLRHNGSHFLSPASRDMPFYQAVGLDICAFLLTSTAVLLAIAYKITYSVARLLTRGAKVKND